MPVVTIKIDEEMFKTLKSKFPYHGDISRVIRNAIKAINKGIEFTPEGSLNRINHVPILANPITSHLQFLDNIDDELLKKIAFKNADSINESFYVNGIHSKDALKMIFSTLQLSNVLTFKWVEPEDQSGVVLIYVEKTIYPTRVMKLYFSEYIKYFCKINRLLIDISGTEKIPVYRITLEGGGVFI